MTVLPKVLVVEDDPDAGRSIQRSLSRYAVTLAGTGRRGIDLFEESRPDLVLVDFELPDATGARLVRELRSRRDSVPIILMSGMLHVQVSAESMAFGADDFIAKPFSRDAIETKIDRQLAAYALRREVAQQEAEVRRLREARDQEYVAASAVLDRMISRGDYDPAWIRHEVLTPDRFAGDAVFAAVVAPDRFRFMIGDVTGHTMASALVTIPLSMMFYATARKDVGLAEALATFDRELARMLPVHMFCAGVVGECDRTRGVLQLWNGGLPDVMIRRSSGVVVRIPSQGPPLAADRFVARHPIVEVDVGPGDRIFALSDGVVEAEDTDGRVFGLARVVEEIASGDPSGGFERVLAALRAHAIAPQDDASLVEVRV